MKSRKQGGDKPAEPPAFRNEALKQALGRWKTESPRPAPAPKAPPAPPKAAPQPRGGAVDDDAFFRAAMEDVRPLPRAAALSEGSPAAFPAVEAVDEDAEALARLAELVATGEGLDLAETDGDDEGLARGVDTALLVPLRRGDFSVQAHLDLHGLGAEPAKAELERFLTDSRRRGHRCVVVVHGRGGHSKAPVLKERVATWLCRGKLARVVLAFATARPVDGGAGALYVLLRR